MPRSLAILVIADPGGRNGSTGRPASQRHGSRLLEDRPHRPHYRESAVPASKAPSRQSSALPEFSTRSLIGELAVARRPG